MFNLEFKTEPLNQIFKIQSLEGFEEISSLYEFNVIAYTENLGITMQTFLKKDVTIQINLKNKKRFFSGIIFKIEERENVDDENSTYITYYNIRIVPHFWFLTLSTNSQIFQKEKPNAIIHKLLNESNIKARELNFGTKKEITVQYNETPFNFISRLLEENGIFYYFDHSDKKLIMSKNIKESNFRLGDIFFTKQHIDPFANVITHINFSSEIVSKGFYTVDYNYNTPDLELQTADINQENVYEFPGKFDEFEEGNNFAKNRFEEIRFNEQVLTGKSTVTFFSPGTIFTLKNHPRESLNKEYFIFSVKHSYKHFQENNANQVYFNEFVAIPTTYEFKPSRKTPKPKIYSHQSAIVTGPSDKEIYCDEFGRIKIWFHWDIYGKKDESSCCFVRVAQNWAGSGFGGLVIPRIGMEVVVSFRDGDPDRPLVIGCVYHASNTPPPYPKNQPEISTFKTNSSPGGDGYNELRFNDKKSEEEIFMHAEKDVNVIIENSRTELFVEGDDTKTIKKGDMTEIQKGEGTTHLLKINNGNQIFKIKKGNRETILDNGDRKLTIKKGNSSNFIKDGNYTYTIKKGNQKNNIQKGNKNIFMKEGDFETTIKKGNKSLTIESGNYNIKLKNGNITIKVTGNIEFSATGNISFKADKNIKLKAGMNIETESTMMTKNKAGQMMKNESEIIASKAKMLIKNESGMSITNKADMMFKNQSGMMFEIKSDMMLKIEGGMMLQAKGGMNAQYQGGMMSEHKGGMIAQHSGGVMAMVKGAIAMIN